MAVDLDDTALVRWRASPIAFIEEMLHDPETGRPFVLLEAERAFMRQPSRSIATAVWLTQSWSTARSRNPARPHAPR